MIKLSEFHLGLLTAVLAAFLVYASRSFGPIPGQDYGAGTMPRLIGWCGVALGVYMMLASLRSLPGALRPHLAEWTGSRRSIASALAVLGVILFYILFSEQLGFIPTSVLSLTGLMLALGTRPLAAIAVAVTATLAVYYTFSKLLVVPLPLSPYQTFLG